MSYRMLWPILTFCLSISCTSNADIVQKTIKEPKKCQRIKDVEKRQICWIKYCQKRPNHNGWNCLIHIAEEVLNKGNKRVFCPIAKYSLTDTCYHLYYPSQGRFNEKNMIVPENMPKEGKFRGKLFMTPFEDYYFRFHIQEKHRKEGKGYIAATCQKWEKLFIKARCKLGWEKQYERDVNNLCERIHSGESAAKISSCKKCMINNPICPEWKPLQPSHESLKEISKVFQN